MAKLVSKTYGDALFDLALESNQMEGLFEETQELLPILEENEDLKKIMNHPKIVKEEKQKIIENVFSGKISKELLGLITMLITKGHYNDLNSVLEYFIHRVKEYKKIGTVYVTSAMELTLAQKDSIRRKVLDTTDYEQLDLIYEEDESLIGGIIIRIGDRVVDGSIKSKLARLTSELSKTKLQVS